MKKEHGARMAEAEPDPDEQNEDPLDNEQEPMDIFFEDHTEGCEEDAGSARENHRLDNNSNSDNNKKSILIEHVLVGLRQNGLRGVS